MAFPARFAPLDALPALIMEKYMVIVFNASMTPTSKQSPRPLETTANATMDIISNQMEALA
jgi:hypothetical protein